jgi:steroid delta-isomerase-like uncharacterized protein
MSTQANEALAHRFHMDIFQQGNFAVADEIVAPEFVMHSPGLPPEMQRGPEGAKQFARMLRAGYPDLLVTHDDTISAGEKVVIHWTASGTHTGALLGIPPTGRRMTVTGIDIYRLAEGKLVELWQNWDRLGMLQQLGVLPTPGQPGG